MEQGRRKANGDEIVCRPEIIGDDLELSLYTASGLFLDSLAMPASRLPTKAEQMPPLIGSFVRLVQDSH